MQHICNKYAYNIQTVRQDMHLYAFICQLCTEICLPYVLIYIKYMQAEMCMLYAEICKCAYCMQTCIIYTEICIIDVIYMNQICTNIHTNN